MDPAKGSATAAKSGVRANALAEAIPALSDATGRIEVAIFATDQANLMDLKSNDGTADGSYWPQERLQSKMGGRWLHSDAKNVAYFFNYPLYVDWVKRGNLK